MYIERYVSDIQMYDFEVRMRKLVSDFLQPSFDKMAKHTDTNCNMQKIQGELIVKIAALEEAVYNQGRADPVF